MYEIHQHRFDGESTGEKWLPLNDVANRRGSFPFCQVSWPSKWEERSTSAQALQERQYAVVAESTPKKDLVRFSICFYCILSPFCPPTLSKQVIAIEIDLRQPSMLHGKKGFERIVWACRNVLNSSLTWLLACDASTQKSLDRGK